LHASTGLAQSKTWLGRWLRALLERSKRNMVVVALTNRLPRIVWAVARSGRSFDARLGAV
jgi:transposase